jgi:uncharacterized protein YycO
MRSTPICYKKSQKVDEYVPQAGDYFVCSTGTLSGWFIRLGTFSSKDHAGISLGGDRILEASPAKGVHEGSARQYPQIAWNRHEGLTENERIAIVMIADSYVGLKYNFADIILLAFRQLGLKLLIPFFKKQASSTKAFICSELVAECYRKAGRPISTKPDYLVTPADLANRLMSL